MQKTLVTGAAATLGQLGKLADERLVRVKVRPQSGKPAPFVDGETRQARRARERAEIKLLERETRRPG